MRNIKMHGDKITSADSDDGAVSVLQTALTRLYGNETLQDNTTGRRMWRGEYLNADGKVAGERVPAPIWDAAVALMREIDAHNNAAEDAATERAHATQDARITPVAERIAADMDQADSDL